MGITNLNTHWIGERIDQRKARNSQVTARANTIGPPNIEGEVREIAQGYLAFYNAQIGSSHAPLLLRMDFAMLDILAATEPRRLLGTIHFFYGPDGELAYATLKTPSEETVRIELRDLVAGTIGNRGAELQNRVRKLMDRVLFADLPPFTAGY